MAFKGKEYSWSKEFEILPGKTLELTLTQADLSPEEKAQIQAVVVSPHFSQYFLAARILHFFSSFGVVLLLFMAGLESTIDKLRRAGRAVERAYGILLSGVEDDEIQRRGFQLDERGLAVRSRARMFAALRGFFAEHGINVNAIAPGYMATDNTAPLRADPNRAPDFSLFEKKRTRVLFLNGRRW